jgi:hypothetical protein
MAAKLHHKGRKHAKKTGVKRASTKRSKIVVGSMRKVLNGTADRTAGGLTSSDVIKRKVKSSIFKN